MKTDETEKLKKVISTYYASLQQAVLGKFVYKYRRTIDWYQGRYEGIKTFAKELGFDVSESSGVVVMKRKAKA